MVVGIASVLIAALVPVAAAHAVPSSGILPGSRVTIVGTGPVTATATHGDTLYLGGSIPGIGLRTGGLAATNATTGALDPAVPELEGSGARNAFANRVVADGEGGVYVLGLNANDSTAGVPFDATWSRLDADGRPERGLAQRFTNAAGTASVGDVAVADDGTTYVAGDFTAVDGAPRAGLAALASDGTLAPWAPEVSGGAVQRLYPTADGVVLVGGFTRVGPDGGQPRSGVAQVDATLGAPRAWAPSTGGAEARALTAADAQAGVAIDGTTAYLAGRTRVYAVGLSGAGTVRDLDLRPAGGTISAIAPGASGRLYVGGDFTVIGAQATQPSRPGIAEIAASSGNTTDWAPAAPAGSGRVLAISDDAVHLGGGTSYTCDGTRAYRRSDATRTAWDPRLANVTSGSCTNAESLAVSGDRVWAAGGSFDAANHLARRGYAAVDVAQDRILPWAPASDTNQIDVGDLAVSPDGQTVYTASSGSSLNGRPRTAVAAVAATGAADAAADVRAWDPAPNGVVHQVVPSADGSSVYLGGEFGTVGGQQRENLAEVQAAGAGTTTSWAPNPNGSVSALELAGDGTLYVGGAFGQIGATPASRTFLAAFAAGSANPSAWDPQMDPAAGVDPYTVLDLALADGRVYVGGYFDGQIGGQTRRGVAALNRTDGAATTWDAGLDQPGVRTVSTTANGDVYLVGLDVGASFLTVQGASRPSMVASVTAAGTVTAWNPGVAADGETSYHPTFGISTSHSNEVVEVAGRVVAPIGEAYNPFDGVRQSGFLAFGPATAPAAASPAVPPTVTGRPLVDQRLTCAPGSYEGSRPFTRSYEWRRNGTAIDGQTGASYTTRAVDIDRALSCRERVQNAAGDLEAVSAAVTILAGVPGNDAAPTVTGTATVGRTVACAEGLWSNGVDAYAYAWLRDGTVVDGATGATYALTAADGQRRVACEVVARNAAGESSPARSGAVTVALAGGTIDPPGNDPPGNDPPRNDPPPYVPPAPYIPPPGPPAPVPTPPTGPKVSVATPSALEGRAFRLTLKPSAAGRISVSATVKSGKRTVTVGSGTATAKKAGTVRLTVKPSSAGKRTLKPGRSFRVTFRVTFTAKDGTKTTTSRTYKVKVKR